MYRCPFCGQEFARQKDAGTHVRACKIDQKDPVTAWKPTLNDKNYLRSLRISHE